MNRRHPTAEHSGRLGKLRGSLYRNIRNAILGPLSIAYSYSERPHVTRRELRNLLADYLRTRSAQKELEQGSSRPGIRSIRQLKIEEHKTSDTVFLLGSGGSLNAVTARDWQMIGQHDSIGFNMSVVHEFTPTYFLLERSADAEEYGHFLRMLAMRAGAYRHVPVIVDYRNRLRHSPAPLDLSEFPQDIRSNIHLRAWHELPTTSRSWLRRALIGWRVLWSLGIAGLTHGLHYRSSLCAAITFALLSGYKHIVLLGVDLNDSRYFWQASPEKYAALAPPPRSESERRHVTIDPDHSPMLPIDEFLYLFEEAVLAARHVRLYVGSPQSRLYPRLPLYGHLECAAVKEEQRAAA